MLCNGSSIIMIIKESGIICWSDWRIKPIATNVPVFFVLENIYIKRMHPFTYIHIIYTHKTTTLPADIVTEMMDIHFFAPPDCAAPVVVVVVVCRLRTNFFFKHCPPRSFLHCPSFTIPAKPQQQTARTPILYTYILALPLFIEIMVIIIIIIIIIIVIIIIPSIVVVVVINVIRIIINIIIRNSSASSSGTSKKYGQ
jgi:hypothetical protein